MFWLLCPLFQNVGSKSSPFDSAWMMGGSRPEVKAQHLQVLILVQLHSRKGTIVFSSNSRNLHFFCWHGHGRHCNWWLRGLILGSWLASSASELAWWLQPDVCFCYLWKANKNLVVSVVKSHDVTCNYSTSLSYIQWCLINCKLKATNVIPWYLAQVLPKKDAASLCKSWTQHGHEVRC